ncbi:hypothetical protein GOP47_0007527 [Adiantum capillus-veneris]|uniref:Uncharacterized protein n=1 Tax=Adiantum capillus-veneris TaxID=13818 RepID=A0A9D4V1R4_ADICA|nr:hypothetical protein GOP47_0007527 [Adiantum capillus-veneris]
MPTPDRSCSPATNHYNNHAYLDHNYCWIEKRRSIDEYPSYDGTLTRGADSITPGTTAVGADVGEPPRKSFSMMMKGLGLPGTHKESGRLSDTDELQAPPTQLCQERSQQAVCRSKRVNFTMEMAVRICNLSPRHDQNSATAMAMDPTQHRFSRSTHGHPITKGAPSALSVVLNHCRPKFSGSGRGIVLHRAKCTLCQSKDNIITYRFSGIVLESQLICHPRMLGSGYPQGAVQIVQYVEELQAQGGLLASQSMN